MSEDSLPEEAPVRAGLGRRAARGALVTYAGQGSRILIQVLSVVTLARLLDPSDYGILAMVLAVVGVGEIFRDFGLSSAAIQATTLSQQQRTNLFWINTAIGVVLTGIVFLGAPLLADLYGRPELIDVARVLSLTFIANGLATQFRADLSRRLRFSRLAVVDVAAPLVGLLVAVMAALAGLEYWALVVQQLTQSAVLLTGLVIAARWKPGLPRRGAAMGGLLTFGWQLVGSQLVSYVSSNLDSVIIGTRFGASQLGIYNRGFQLLMTPLSQMRAPTTTVALPILARLSADEDRYSRFIVRGQLALGYTLVAALGVVIGMAEPLTLLLLGEKWSDVAPILRLLAVAGIFDTLGYVGYWVYLSRGLTADLFRYSLLSSAVRVALIIAGSFWGVLGVAVGYALAPALMWPVSLLWLSRRTAIPTATLAKGTLRLVGVVLVIAGGATLGEFLSRDLSTLLQVLVGLVSAVLAYVLAALLVPALRRDARDLIAVVRLVRRDRLP